MYLGKELFDEEGNMLGYEEFVATYNTRVNFVDFYSVTHSLKHKWKAKAYNDMASIIIDNHTRNLIWTLKRTKKVCK